MTVDEQTPLLRHSVDEERALEQRSKPSALPLKQLFVLFSLIVVQPFAFEVIFPFISTKTAALRVRGPEF